MGARHFISGFLDVISDSQHLSAVFLMLSVIHGILSAIFTMLSAIHCILSAIGILEHPATPLSHRFA